MYLQETSVSLLISLIAFHTVTLLQLYFRTTLFIAESIHAGISFTPGERTEIVEVICCSLQLHN